MRKEVILSNYKNSDVTPNQLDYIKYLLDDCDMADLWVTHFTCNGTTDPKTRINKKEAIRVIEMMMNNHIPIFMELPPDNDKDNVVVHLGKSPPNERATSNQITKIRILYRRIRDGDQIFFKHLTKEGQVEPREYINKKNASVLITALEKKQKVFFVDESSL